ncbi:MULTISPECIES: metallophosphoesterase [unclassified Sphingomonas]|uniref:metallophosphoesterase n=1 Tax=unclassified Sphingomonas TaxID=196159 RepID=UPI00226A2147|nr:MULTISPECIES: metallophosphoesterase [unclassified Sphingomonas]
MSGSWRQWVGAVIAVGVLAVIAVAAFAFLEARADPIVRRTAVALPDWPAGAPPITVALLADIHIGSVVMDQRRLTRIVGQVNALRPDLVVIAGDLVDGHDPRRTAIDAPSLTAPLSRLRAPLGVVAVLGNHDHYTLPTLVAAAMRRAGITVLANQALARGPLAVIGVDDAFTGHADAGEALRQAARLSGARLVVSHSPDLLPMLPPGSAPLVLTGHTHCGQGVVLGITLSPYLLHSKRIFDPRYRCGIVQDPGRKVIITAGLGTSNLPFRIGAPPDLWLVRLGPAVSPPRP